MNTFAFIVHPITIAQLKDFWPLIRVVPDFIIKTSLKNLPPFKVSHIKGVRSAQGKEVQGYFIACPLLPKQMLDLQESFVLEKIISAAHIAERLGANIVGLGGYTSIIGDKGQTIADNLKIPVTSGNTYTAWSVFEAIYRMAKVKNIDLKKSHLAIIGATGSIGSLCTRKLSEYVAKITVTARHRDKLEQLKEIILNLNGLEVNIEEEVHKAVKDADIIITTTSAPEALLNIEELKSGALVCDVSVPKNIAGRENPRRDISLIDGGLIKLPNPSDFGVDTGLPKDMVYACVAETMLLTLEGRFINYSLGDNINLDKMEEIANIAVQHGFEVWVPEAPLL
jgi:predicted amino acid dehydrogenase